MKRFVSLLLVFCMMAVLVPHGIVSVHAASGTTGACTWTLDGTKLTIRGQGAMDSFFSKAPWGTSVTEVVVEEGVTNLAQNFLAGCTSLRKVSLANSVSGIGSYAFENCTSLTSITLPERLGWMNPGAFTGCTSLVEIHIPQNVYKISEDVFENCSSLVKITVDDSNRFYCAADGVLYTKDMKTVVKYPENKPGTHYTVPDTVTTIERGSFSGAKKLVTLDLPDTITRIGIDAFANTAMYRAAKADGEDAVYIGPYLIELRNFSRITSVYVREGTRVIADYAGLVNPAKHIYFPDSLVAIGECAFGICQSLEDITLPKSVKYIGKGAFFDCDALKTVYYRGTSGDRAKITIESGTEELSACTWRYNACMGKPYHSWNVEVAVRQVSCTEDGIMEKTCLHCGEKQTRSISALNHNIVVSQTKNPTCVEAGTKEHLCTRCDYKKTETVAPTGHVFGPWTAELLPTCTDVGVDKRACSLCGTKEARNTEATGHTFGEWIEAEKESCTDESTATRTCSVCAATESKDVPAEEHTFGEWIEAKKESCTDESTATRTCSVCAATETKPVPAEEHTFGEWTTDREPTCEDDGEEIRTCSVCGATEKRTLAAFGHTFGEATVAKKPTLKEEGLSLKSCENCGETATEPIPVKELSALVWILPIAAALVVAGVIVCVVSVKKRKKAQ